MKILGLIIIFLILYIAAVITALKEAPYWDEVHGFYTKQDIKDLENWAKEINNKFNT